MSLRTVNYFILELEPPDLGEKAPPVLFYETRSSEYYSLCGSHHRIAAAHQAVVDGTERHRENSARAFMRVIHY